MEENKVINQEPTQEDMIQLLSQTIIKQDAEIKELKAELSKPSELSEEDEKVLIHNYLLKQQEYAECKVKELRHHLADYPEDDYSKTDLQNTLLHLNFIRAMIRRLYL